MPVSDQTCGKKLRLLRLRMYQFRRKSERQLLLPSSNLLGGNMSTPPPSPKHILRNHRYQITSLHISDDNERLYSGDITGLVVLTATRTLRALATWKAHVSAILAVREWEGVDRYVIS